MTFSLLTRHIHLAAISVAARTARPVVPCTIARRTIFVTPRLAATAKASQQTEEKPASKKAEKKTGEIQAPVTRGRPPKGSLRQVKKSEDEKQRVRVPKSLKPPKRAAGPYLLFYTSFLKSQTQAKTLADYQALSKRAGEIWRGYTIAEKQPFYDESETLKVKAKQEREQFFNDASLSDLKQLNAIRKVQGKTKFRLKKNNRPPSSFLQFSNEFRNSTEAQGIIKETFPEKTYAVRAALAATNRWRSMSEEEKAPYFEKYKKAKAEKEAESTES